MEHDIQTFSLVKKFGDITAVDNLNINVRKNTIYGLIGPDGAGKTTTMRMLCSLIKPDSGTGKVGGLDIVKNSEEIKKHMGYMPQKFSLYGDLTVIENLEFYSEIYQVPKRESKEKIKFLLEFSSLLNHSYKLADQLSGGMKQKLALSCNLIHTPKYLFLDEPTIGVDPVARRELWKILFDLREQGVTIFVSTPYMDEAERCDEIGLMYQGSIIKSDRPDNIIRDFDKHILCIVSDDIYSLKEAVQGIESVQDVYLRGEELHVVTANMECTKNIIEESLKNINLDFVMSENIPTLEDVFVNIVKSRAEMTYGKCN
ncbi:ABC transporter ATP-binding protein [Sedimentibacter saalensis]|uniref:ABC-2 type transport system ATP-binding protein n=1 Tax=Sedimentibacter saalensis TaxID=130788 RepID=A0A562J5J6_9FIRM|nr:ABC transporter ATP-binding protein [Sedimentibacter saalensis]TWH78377.1 ABC-2 type transport system ATP-binding protein [Sedimentibacter saalensis]